MKLTPEQEAVATEASTRIQQNYSRGDGGWTVFAIVSDAIERSLELERAECGRRAETAIDEICDAIEEHWK